MNATSNKQKIGNQQFHIIRALNGAGKEQI